ncbi:hypothetical protein [Aquisphaera giovannonii]|uniref:hypothetical protein n=1 Tax=Aquisphaera giovannonii TaxID=406548 RepID=UPI0011DFE243|nr:hypothetical protein [Aquisphaera giovannonii]
MEARQLLSGLSHPARVAEVRAAARAGADPGRTLDLPDALVYIPAGLEAGRAYPMVVAFTPDGKVKRTLNDWRGAADRFHWIVYASKGYSNATAGAADFDAYARSIWAMVEAAIARFPVDRTRLILAGFSGGGSFAEYVNSRAGGPAAAMVIDANGTYAYGDDPMVPFPASSAASSRRLAAFLYSPTDRRFGQATRMDQAFYHRKGWDTTLLSYKGGHVDAPPGRYLAAATWIASRPAWLA